MKTFSSAYTRVFLFRSILILAAGLLFHGQLKAQPPNPVETDTLAPFVTSTSIGTITASSAVLGGNVTGNGGAAVTERGVVYSATNALPTVGDTKVIIGNGNGVYSQTITGLTGGTLYYVRAYATNIIGTSYGAVISFTTNASPPVVTTSEVSAITNTSALVGGNISFFGGAAVTERGVVYSAVNNLPTVADTKVQIGSGSGNFSQTISGLTTGTSYSLRAYAINAAGTSYGSVISFTPAGASVSTDPVSNISTTSATMGGNVSAAGGSAVTDKGVIYIAGSGVPAITDNKTSMGSGTGTFSQSITSLLPGTFYSMRAYATNASATNFGSVQTFTTQTTLSSINRVGGALTNAIVVNYTVTFAQSVTGLTASNFSLTTTGVNNAYVTAVSGSGTTWNVTAYTGTGNGTIILNLANSTGISPGISNTLPFAGQLITIDRTPPTVSSVSISSNNSDTTRAKVADNVTVTFTASEAITVTAATIDGQTATPANTGGNTWKATYTMKGTDAEGLVPFSIAYSDLAGNAGITATAVSNTSSVTFDRTPPVTSSITVTTLSPVNASTVPFTVTFSEPVKNVAVAAFALTVTSITGASITTVTGSGAVYIVTVNTGSGNGTIRLDVNSTGTNITDLTGNPISSGYNSGQVYTITKIIIKPTVKTTNPAAVCAPATIDLSLPAITSGSDPGLVFSYFTDAAGTIPLITPSAVTTSGTYYITGTNNAGVASDPVPVTVTVNAFQKPKAAFSYNSYCTGLPVSFTNNSTTTGSGTIGYQWNDNNGNSAAIASPSFTYVTAAAYTVKLKVFSLVCPQVADSITQVITIAVPVPAVRMPSVNLFINEATSLQARTTVGTTYQWTPSTGLSVTTVSNPVTIISSDQTYLINITAASGCITVDTLLARVYDNRIYVPNVFSPNGDGINDRIYVNLIGITRLNYFRIFNRYGKQLYQTTDPDPALGWDGKVNGVAQPIDTYIWIVNGVDKNGVILSKQGTFTLLR